MNDVAQSSDTPDIYRQVEVLTLARHGDLGLVPDVTYGFAKSLASVPASMSEIVVAQRSYPIVFAGNDAPVPVICLGLGKKTANLFVGEDGKWEVGQYIPSFFRRYPFIAVPKQGADELVLAADVNAEHVGKDTGHPFFSDGKPTDEAKRAFDMCAKMHVDFQAAREFGAALQEKGLLREHTADIRLGPDNTVKLTGFRMIDERKLDALDDSTFLDWRRRGWLPAAYAQLMSLASWNDLAQRAKSEADGTSG